MVPSSTADLCSPLVPRFPSSPMAAYPLSHPRREVEEVEVTRVLNPSPIPSLLPALHHRPRSLFHSLKRIPFVPPLVLHRRYPDSKSPMSPMEPLPIPHRRQTTTTTDVTGVSTLETFPSSFPNQVRSRIPPSPKTALKKSTWTWTPTDDDDETKRNPSSPRPRS